MLPAIEAQGVSKIFSRKANTHLSYGFRDLIREATGRRRVDVLRTDEFYAARDVSFTLQPGDTFAIIGRNGSGKSTLLRMLSGLIKPDSGRIVVRGKVQALINLGAGFSPQLSGRDNILLAASLVGLARAQTASMIEEIVDFSELGDFIDSPVSTYSTGMRARLGFAAAVHLEPDILLIDEVLAVGDFAFQNKCFARMEELKKRGTTIIFVSHSHAKVIQLCDQALWMHEGQPRLQTKSQPAVEAYLQFLEQEEAKRIGATARRRSTTPPPPNSGGASIPADARAGAGTVSVSAKLDRAASSGMFGPTYDQDSDVTDLRCSLMVGGRDVSSVPVHASAAIRYSFELSRHTQKLHFTFNIFRNDGVLIAAIDTLQDGTLSDVHIGHVSGEVRVPDFDLTPGTYVLVWPICDGKRYLFRNIVKEFSVYGGGRLYWGIKAFTYEHVVKSPVARRLKSGQTSRPQP